MKARFASGIAASLCVAILAIQPTTSDASSFQKAAHQNRIGFSASKLQRASGEAQTNGAASSAGTPRSIIKYMVLPWHGLCINSTQICTSVSDRHCERIHRDDKQNRWRPFDVYISYDGHTYEGFPDRPLHRGMCLNATVIDKRDKQILDPRLVIERVTRLVPQGEWHAEQARRLS